MQNTATGMTIGTVQMADFAVGAVHQYQWLRICQRNLTPHCQTHCVQLETG